MNPDVLDVDAERRFGGLARLYGAAGAARFPSLASSFCTPFTV